MFKPSFRQRCIVCGRKATRTISIDGDDMAPLCIQCPSPEEIRRRVDKIKFGWSKHTELARRFDCSWQIGQDRATAWFCPELVVMDGED